MDADVLVSANDLYRYYGQYCAVDNLSLALRQGEVLGLLGPNGAGKSSTLQMLTGNLAPSAGQIWINGIDLLDSPRTAKRHIGYLPEQPPLYRDLTVDEYLCYCARLHGIDARGITQAVEFAKTRCGLEHTGRRLIGNLSKGFQQRVGIAQAIIHTPAVVVLDEPTVGLDPIQIREIRELIRELGREHSVILSTHILPEVQAVCDRVQIIDRGRTVFDDTLDGLESRHASPVLTAGFETPPPVSELYALPGVEFVEDLPDGRLRITHREGESPAAVIAETATREGWGLTELTPERATLEQIFMELIYHENAEQAA
jgi:ABC-2 type transport system ATP-binding protein